MTIEYNNFLLTINFRWGIGVDLESTGAPIPTMIYDDEGIIEAVMYNGWCLRVPFMFLTVGRMS